MDGFSHTAILASAGSGKTWQLSTRYLRLLALGANPSRILASTFTRAAAGEIRDRILSRLAQAAEDARECGKLAEAIAVPNLKPPRAVRILAELVRSLDCVQIRTLDSFFSSIVRCFSMELGLPRDVTIVEGGPELALRREAIRSTLQETEHDALVEWLRLMVEGRSDRSVSGAIDSVVTSLHELYREAQPQAWEAIDFWPLSSGTDISAAIEGLERGRARVTDSRHLKSLDRDIGCARECRLDSGDDWARFIDNGLASRVAADDRTPTYYGKPIAADLLPHYRALIHHARGAMRNMLASRTRAMRRLLERFDRAYERVRFSRGEITFADLTAAVTSDRFVSRPDLLDELYYRLDGRIDHLLFDEMQDTSAPQWRALRPMVEEIIATRAGERTFFCVGDVKQSIYGWREARPELLESLCRTHPHIIPETLARSWRSAQPVIDAVNRVFTCVSANPALDDTSDASEAWDAGWETHETVRSELAGFVELRAVKPVPRNGEDEARQADIRFNEAADLAALLHHRRPDLTIGVLTRTNKAAARMLFEVGPVRRNLPATARGGGLLTDAPPVNAILDALRLADHPGHSIAAFNVMHSPLAEHIGLLDSGDARENQGRITDTSRRIRADVQERGLAAVIDEWARALAPSVDARQLRRLRELCNAAERFERDLNGVPTRCDDFVRAAASMIAADPPPAPIEVMTIHKSKGLEFDAVILPDLQEPLAEMKHVNVVTQRSESDASVLAICAGRTRETTWSQFDDLKSMFEVHRNRLARESLCLLYVAMTRAKQGLYMLIDPVRRKKDGEISSASRRSHAGLLVNALASAPPTEAGVAFAHGDADWMEKDRGEMKPAPTIDQVEIAAPIQLAAPASVRPAAARSPSFQAALGHARTLADLLKPQPGGAFDHGLGMHSLFELVEWLEDGQPSRRQCSDALAIALPKQSQAWRDGVIDSFLAALARTAVSEALSRNGLPAASMNVWRELRFAREVDGTIEQGAIDRLVAWCEIGDRRRFARGLVIDFKTDDVAADDCAVRASTYEAQIAAYRAAAAEFLGIGKNRVEAALLFVNPGVAIQT